MKRQSERDMPVPMVRSGITNGPKMGGCELRAASFTSIIVMSKTAGQELLKNHCESMNLFSSEMTKTTWHYCVMRSNVTAMIVDWMLLIRNI